MARRDGSLGYMLQGVSQQKPRLRLEGQVTEQINLLPDVNLGLTSRPGTAVRHRYLADPVGAKFKTFVVDGHKYRIAHSDGAVSVKDYDGNVFAISAVGSALAYFGPDMSGYVLEDVLYMTNRNKIADIGVPRSTPSIQYWGYVYALGGLFSREFKVTLRYEDGTFAVGTYKTPNGTGDDDADRTASNYIVAQLKTSLEGASGFKSGTTVEQFDDHLLIQYKVAGTNQPISLDVQDGEANTILKGGAAKARTLADLPKFAPNNAIALIYGDTDQADDYWMKFVVKEERTDTGVTREPSSGSLLTSNTYWRRTGGGAGYGIRWNGRLVGNTSATSYEAPDGWVYFLDNTNANGDLRGVYRRRRSGIGSGLFGAPGTWVETVSPGSDASFNPATMPHQIIIDRSTLTATVQASEWFDRRVGNSDNNKTPSFIGATIRDIGEFQSRLVFTTGNGSVVMSRTKSPTDFFRKTALNELADDPIDVRPNKEGTSDLDWIVSFDRDLFIFSDSAQFAITGSTGITPMNASIVTATEFVMSANAKPKSAGRTVLLPYKSRTFSGINEYFTADDYAANAVEDLNKVTKRYIEGDIIEITVSPNDGLAMVLCDNDPPDRLYVYKYLWEGLEKTQSAWFKWDFPGAVQHVHCQDGIIYIWMVPTGSIRESLVEMYLDKPIDNDLYHLSMDLKVSEPITGNTTVVTTPYPRPVVIAVEGQLVEGTTVFVGGATQAWETTVDTTGKTGEVTVGRRIPWTLIPTEPIPRDYQGNPAPSITLIVEDYSVDFADSGEIKAEMLTRFRQFPIQQDFNWFPMDTDPQDPLSMALRTGTMDIGWGEDSTLAELKLSSDDIRPVNLQEIRYRAQSFKAGG